MILDRRQRVIPRDFIRVKYRLFTLTLYIYVFQKCTYVRIRYVMMDIKMYIII